VPSLRVVFVVVWFVPTPTSEHLVIILYFNYEFNYK